MGDAGGVVRGVQDLTRVWSMGPENMVTFTGKSSVTGRVRRLRKHEGNREVAGATDLGTTRERSVRVCRSKVLHRVGGLRTLP